MQFYIHSISRKGLEQLQIVVLGAGGPGTKPHDAEGQLYFNLTELTIHYLTF